MTDAAGEVREEEALDAQAEARRRVALAQIRQYGDPALRMRAHDVEAFDEELARLVERMAALMTDARGVGLAGTQVGILRRVTVVRPDDEQPVLALVNPRIVERSDVVAVADEGCLSLQGVLVPVERACRVTVEARDVTGAAVTYELSNLAARVVQHEVDHLDGVLILDRTTDEARREALAALRPRTLIA
jgi:peptide deformylase